MMGTTSRSQGEICIECETGVILGFCTVGEGDRQNFKWGLIPGTLKFITVDPDIGLTNDMC